MSATRQPIVLGYVAKSFAVANVSARMAATRLYPRCLRVRGAPTASTRWPWAAAPPPRRVYGATAQPSAQGRRLPVRRLTGRDNKCWRDAIVFGGVIGAARGQNR